MSLLYTIQEAENNLILLCPVCMVSVGIVTHQEAAEYSKANIQPLCFQCDLLDPDIVPVHLIDFAEHFMLGIADKIFLVEWLSDNALANPKLFRFSMISLTTYFDLKTGFGVSYTPLASTLNLNKKPLPKASFLVVEGEVS